MHPAMDAVEEKLDILVDALDGHDAVEIMTASEGLSHAVLALTQLHIPEGSEDHAHRLITKTLAQLEAAAMRVNILKNWTRQRIDRNHQLRGIRQRGMQLSY